MAIKACIVWSILRTLLGRAHLENLCIFGPKLLGFGLAIRVDGESHFRKTFATLECETKFSRKIKLRVSRDL